MSANEDLQRFVREGLSGGVPREKLEEVLITAGWDGPEVRAALAAFADELLTLDHGGQESSIPVPRPKPSLSSRDAFLYLLLFTTLYISSFYFGRLVFELINYVFPDPLLSSQVNFDPDWNIRFPVANLLVSFPVFAGVSWKLGRDLTVSLSRRVSPIRRWLTYMTLFIAAAVLIGDVTALVFNILAGGLTLPFVLKTLT